MAAIKDEVLTFVQKKLSSVTTRLETKVADADVIAKSLTDPDLVK